MAVRTVRLDDDSEQILSELARSTGLSISALFKQGLAALREKVQAQAAPSAYEIYKSLDLGPGGYASAPSTESRRGAAEAIRRKHSR
ncbi:MAG TPA: ribbon-helix-helix protein, CopG family [Thermoanaerobaculia bacterium]